MLIFNAFVTLKFNHRYMTNYSFFRFILILTFVKLIFTFLWGFLVSLSSITKTMMKRAQTYTHARAYIRKILKLGAQVLLNWLPLPPTPSHFSSYAYAAIKITPFP